MYRLAILALVGLAACAAGPGPASYPNAQAIVDKATAGEDGLVRLTIHAVPTGGDRARVVASNVADKLDDWSDPEDLEAMEKKQPVSMPEGDHLDYTVPVIDAAGNAIAAVGVTVAGADDATKLARAKAIAAEVSAAILAAPAALW